MKMKIRFIGWCGKKWYITGTREDAIEECKKYLEDWRDENDKIVFYNYENDPIGKETYQYTMGLVATEFLEDTDAHVIFRIIA